MSTIEATPDVPDKRSEKPNSITHQRRQREREERQRQILAAASRVFARDGYLRANVEEIAREAELSKGTLYLYFPSKRDLLLALLEESNEELNRLLSAAIEEAQEPLRKLAAIIESILEYFDRNLDLMRVTLVEFMRLAGTEDEIVKTILKHHHWRTERMRQVIRQGQAAGLIRAVPEELIMSHLSGAIRNVMVDKLEGDLKDDIRSYIPDVVELFLRGVQAAPSGGA